MSKLNTGQVKKLLVIAQNFILREILHKDSIAQYEIKEGFQQLFDLLENRTLHP